ncbi:amidohydrolase family protein [Bradyrhizobium diazoefficiens]|nr:amidohydrolase family protein [Bradyrhizobium diazoefficiens]WLA67132.1 amidohydrolase family protein [Bradyrhizobium diazoefficiens]
MHVEEHQSNAHTIAAQLASLVIEGVPERFPKLKIVFIEGGFGWIPSAVWRMDQHFERFCRFRIIRFHTTKTHCGHWSHSSASNVLVFPWRG